MEQSPPLSRTVDLHGLETEVSIERAREAIEALPPGGALEVFTGDPALGENLRELTGTRGFDFLDSPDHGTLCYLIYRPF